VALHLLHDLPPIVCGCMFGSARASSTGLKWSAEPLPSVASHGTSIFHHSFPDGCSASNSLLVMIVHSRPAHVDVALYHTSPVLNPSRSQRNIASEDICLLLHCAGNPFFHSQEWPTSNASDNFSPSPSWSHTPRLEIFGLLGFPLCLHHPTSASNPSRAWLLR
jgi:hypothetical protein